MPVEIGLVGGNTLHLTDENQREDDVLRRLTERSNPPSVGGYITIEATVGTYRVNPAQVVYVRWVDEAPVLVDYR